VGDFSESERDYTKYPNNLKKIDVSYEEAMNYARNSGYLYIEASRESGFNMAHVTILACQTYLKCGVRNYNEEKYAKIRYIQSFCNMLLYYISVLIYVLIPAHVIFIILVDFMLETEILMHQAICYIIAFSVFALL
jgi:hypothetical protein